jgi:hypothetical protein
MKGGIILLVPEAYGDRLDAVCCAGHVIRLRGPLEKLVNGI